jgi:hypothetical protein
MSFGDLFKAMQEAIAALEERAMDDRSTYLMVPRKGNLSNYGRDPQHRRTDMMEPGKYSGDGSEGAPQVYVRFTVELSYDKPRPDPDGALRKECGAAIRRAVEAKLTGEGLAAQLGDATVTLRSMMMRQEEDLEAFGKPVSVTVGAAGSPGEVRFEAASPGVETVPNPTHEEARPSVGTVPLPRDTAGSIGCFAPVEDDMTHDFDDGADDIPPNAGSAE